MDKLITKDGSITYFNESYGDFYNSKAGAVNEAEVKYVAPCRIKEIAAEREVSVLDIGFGLGYNIGVALDAVAAIGGSIRVVSLEMDEAVRDVVQDLRPDISSYHKIQKLAREGRYEDDKISMKLLMGDARETIKEAGNGFDAVFHDPFAPTRNPELWTKEFFMDVKRLMKPGAILATYSCARHVRDNLRAAGFEVKDGPVFGRRGPSTIAIN
jgi:tRNA U34 5-methylaminomethyl-2-thiouridine-forming methyltransferase MnmC